MKSLKEKVILLALGTVVTFITFLSSSYLGGFVTKAAYNKDKANISIIINELVHLKNGQDEIKKMIRDKK